MTCKYNPISHCVVLIWCIVSTSSVVFPGPTFRAGDDKDNALDIPDECKRIGICDVASDTKDILIENIIRDYQRWNRTFNRDELQIPKIAERIGPTNDYDGSIQLCESVTKLLTPKYAQDSNNNWHRIVNTDKSPEQRFYIETCKMVPGTACSSIATFKIGYKSSCIQKYILRQMVALNADDEVIEKGFMVPSCCSCVVQLEL